MITLTSLEYELNEKPENVFSRLKWRVEQVESSWQDYMNWSTTPATHKDWIGEIDERNLSFSMEEAGSFFKRKFNVVIKGDLEIRDSTLNVNIRLGLDNLSFLWIVMIYLGAGLFISDAFTNNEFDSYFSLVFFLLAYPILGTFLISRRMKSAEKKLDIIFN